MKKYRVNEIFYTLQGEGLYTGTPMVFVRFSGCNRSCPFCDTDFTEFETMTAEEIVAETQKYPTERVVLTGGEPLLQTDDELIKKLHAAGLKIHIETNGTLQIPEGIDHVVCSPKDEIPAIQPNAVDEVKIVYQGQPTEELEKIGRFFPFTKFFYLQPCSCINIGETVEKVKELKGWRLSLQTHKLIDIK